MVSNSINHAPFLGDHLGDDLFQALLHPAADHLPAVRRRSPSGGTSGTTPRDTRTATRYSHSPAK
jgi:hypothetical protein